MDIYEAATYYDFITCAGRDGVVFPRKLLIVDTDKYSVYFCECSEKGICNKICEYILPEENDCISEMDKVLSQQTEKKRYKRYKRYI